MNTSTKLLLASAASVLVAAAVSAQPIPPTVDLVTDTQPPAISPQEILAMYDFDHDRRLDRWERLILERDVEAGDLPPPPAWRRRDGEFRRLVLAMYDADNDGVLNRWERLILERDIAAGEIEPPGRPRPRETDSSGARG